MHKILLETDVIFKVEKKGHTSTVPPVKILYNYIKEEDWAIQIEEQEEKLLEQEETKQLEEQKQDCEKESEWIRNSLVAYLIPKYKYNSDNDANMS